MKSAEGLGKKQKSSSSSWGTIPFGKYFIDRNYLDSGILKVVYRSGVQVKSIPISRISDRLRKILHESSMKNSFCKDCEYEASRLDTGEKKILQKFLKSSNFNTASSVKSYQSDEDQQLMNRFELLKSEIEAGNDSDELLHELKQLTKHLASIGLIQKRQANKILLQLV
jgi:hypothetical protein